MLFQSHVCFLTLGATLNESNPGQCASCDGHSHGGRSFGREICAVSGTYILLVLGGGTSRLNGISIAMIGTIRGCTTTGIILQLNR